MKKLFEILIVFLLVSGGAVAQTGTISGYVFNENGEPMAYAEVLIITESGNKGAVADFDGKFVVKPLNSGLYDIKVSFVGYHTKTITGVEVYSDKITYLNKVELQPNFVIIEDIDVIAFKEKIIDPEEPSRITIRGADIQQMPGGGRDIPNVLRSISSDVKVSDNGKEIYFRGSRNSASAYYVDGVRVSSLQGVVGSAIGSFMMYSGGVPAKYGDFTGGVVVVETKSYFDVENEWKAKMSRMNR